MNDPKPDFGATQARRTRPPSPSYQETRELQENVGSFIKAMRGPVATPEDCDGCSKCIQAISTCDGSPKAAAGFWFMLTTILTSVAVGTDAFVRNAAIASAVSGVSGTGAGMALCCLVTDCCCAQQARYDESEDRRREAEAEEDNDTSSPERLQQAITTQPGAARKI